VGFEWFEDGRADRIAARIGGGHVRDVEACCALQCDTRSELAARLIDRLPATASDAARALLTGWDARAEVGSAAALLFELWFSSHLRPALLDRVADTPELRAHLVPGNPATVVRLFEGAQHGIAGRAGLEDVADREAFLAETLRAAWDDAVARYGADPEAWRWGDLHAGYFAHAVTAVKAGFDLGPWPKGGSATTVMLAQYDAATYRVTHGASVRMVVDVGEWDNSVWINAPGQSGLPKSPHHADLAPLWARGDYVPMLYTPEAVDAAVVETIELTPG